MPSGQDQLHRLGFADGAHQTLRAAGPWNDAELDLGLAEFGGVRGQDKVAHHGQLAAAAERIAGDGGDDRLARPRHASQRAEEVVEIGLGEGLVAHLLDVGAGGESLVGAGEHDAADSRVRLETRQTRSRPRRSNGRSAH